MKPELRALFPSAITNPPVVDGLISDESFSMLRHRIQVLKALGEMSDDDVLEIFGEAGLPEVE